MTSNAGTNYHEISHVDEITTTGLYKNRGTDFLEFWVVFGDGSRKRLAQASPSYMRRKKEFERWVRILEEHAKETTRAAPSKG